MWGAVGDGRNVSGGSSRSLAWRGPWTVSRQHLRRAQISGSLGQHRHTHTSPLCSSSSDRGRKAKLGEPPPYHTHTLTHTNPLQRLSKMGREVVCGESLIMSQCNQASRERNLFSALVPRDCRILQNRLCRLEHCLYGLSCQVSSLQPASVLWSSMTIQLEVHFMRGSGSARP